MTSHATRITGAAQPCPRCRKTVRVSSRQTIPFPHKCPHGARCVGLFEKGACSICWDPAATKQAKKDSSETVLSFEAVREAVEHVWTDATRLPESRTKDFVCRQLQLAAERLDEVISPAVRASK